MQVPPFLQGKDKQWSTAESKRTFQWESSRLPPCYSNSLSKPMYLCKSSRKSPVRAGNTVQQKPTPPGPSGETPPYQLLWQSKDFSGLFVGAFLLVTFSLDVPLPQLFQPRVSPTAPMQENTRFGSFQEHPFVVGIRSSEMIHSDKQERLHDFCS